MGRGCPSGPRSLYPQAAAEVHGGTAGAATPGPEGQRNPSRLDSPVALAFLEFILLSEKHA